MKQEADLDSEKQIYLTCEKYYIFELLIFAAGMMAVGGTAGNVTSKAATRGSGSVVVSSAVSGKTSEASVEDWYKTVLEDDAIKKEYFYYKLQDIDLDGVDELFLSTTPNYFIGDGDRACLMANVNGEAKVLQEIGGNAGEFWNYSQSDASLCHFSRLSGEGHYVLYKLKDGKLEETGSADSYGPHHYTVKDNKEKLYLINDKEVSEEEFDSFVEQYGSVDGAMTYEAIDGAAVDYGKSDIYDQEDMDEAIKLIRKEFAGWTGCELHNIRYTSDDCNSKENIKSVNSLADGKKYTQCIKFRTDFHSPTKNEDLEKTAWEPDKEYKDYEWTLAREDDGNWELVNCGY